MSPNRNLFERVGIGVNRATGNLLGAVPTFGSVVPFARDVLIESLPSDQKTGLDKGEAGTVGNIDTFKKGVETGDVVGATVENQSNKVAGAVREDLAEGGARMAGSAIVKRFPGIASRFGALAGGSAGVLALPASILAAGEFLDAGVQATTGKGILEWSENPEQIRGRSGAKRAGY